MKQRNFKIALLGAASLLIVVGAAQAAEPAKAHPAAMMTAPMADADMQVVLDQLAALRGKPIETLTPVEARKQPTPADAVKAAMVKKGLSTAPDPAVTTKDVTYTGGDGSSQKARIYMPAGTPADAKAAKPVILYIHGGGWVIADIDVYDSSPRALSKAIGAIVVSIEYRHAPEAKFPAAHDDANAAYKWVLANAASWGGDPAKIALVGESAGGNMAVDVAIAARDHKWPAPLHVVAIYPVASKDMNTPSKKAFAAAKPLNTPMLGWFFKHTLADMKQASDPRLDLVSANLKDLPPTTIILAEIDPLHDDGVMLSHKLKAAGVDVDLKEYTGVTHEFFGMGSIVAGAKDAEAYASGKLNSAFSKP